MTDDAAREEALARARETARAEAAEREAGDRRRKRRSRIGQVAIGVIFAVMMFQRAVEGGWLEWLTGR
ncbi:MAG: hypothetical protein H3C51_05875 [Rubellimicrobium sp.]|nr:hypothetical protein [Rubellimicrobium sp.]